MDEQKNREQIVAVLINKPESEFYSIKWYYKQLFDRSLGDKEWGQFSGNKGSSSHGRLNIELLTPAIISWRLWQSWLVAHPILETDFNNPSPPIDESNPNWGSILVGGKIFLANDEPKYEWVPILPSLSSFEQFESSSTTAGFAVGLSGFAVTPERSQADLPFTHPFANDDDFGLPPQEGGPPDGIRHPWGNVGNDFTFGVAPDKQYWPLLATSNLDLSAIAPWIKPSNEVSDGLAETPIGFDVPGILHVEEDMGLLPVGYRPGEFDRVAIYGRWIIDAGHDDFGSEIHPPTLLAVARPNGDNRDETISTLIGLPYFVSQIFGHDDNENPLGLRTYLFSELSKKDADLFGPHFGMAQATLPYGPLLNTMPNIYPGFGPDGSFIYFFYTLRLPSGRKSSSDKLIVRANFKTRTGVIPLIVAGNDELYVYIITTPDYVAAQTPLQAGWLDISKDDLLNEASQSEIDAVNQYLSEAINGIRQGRKPDGSQIPSVADWDALANGLQDLINRGVSMPWYKAPAAPSPEELDQNAFEILMEDWSGPKEAPRDIDDHQPFPICGSIKLRWSRA
ncbi:hypothetical protein [Mucilaginibacter sp.]|uniref:hypothetical protein n=1 Tax=Mucilaginibacter sp. TaxID=1882438 RepID=UPI0026321798|nr:hypothetical protein [Mucilaginibacter sp.]